MTAEQTLAILERDLLIEQDLAADGEDFAAYGAELLERIIRRDPGQAAAADQHRGALLTTTRRIRLDDRPALRFDPQLLASSAMIGHHKPAGLWYGIGDSWREWCEENQREWIKPYSYEIDVDASLILMIGDLASFDAFEAAHSYVEDRWRELAQRSGMPAILRYQAQIDWARVAEQYAGIEINPYLWERHLGSLWYYGWDCASGCVWDARAIRGIRPI